MSDLCKVLIVDDEYIMRQGIKHLVNWDKEGFLIVGEATNGKEALIMVEELKPHIVVMDVVMPVMDGVELTKEVHEKYPDIKIIVLSGFDDFCCKGNSQKRGNGLYFKAYINRRGFSGSFKESSRQHTGI